MPLDAVAQPVATTEAGVVAGVSPAVRCTKPRWSRPPVPALVLLVCSWCCVVGYLPVLAQGAVVDVNCTDQSPPPAGEANIVPADNTVYTLRNCTKTIGFHCLVEQDPARCGGAAQFWTSLRNVSILVDGGTTLPAIDLEAMGNITDVVLRFTRVDTARIAPQDAARGTAPIVALRAGNALASIVVEFLSCTIVGMETRGLLMMGDGEGAARQVKQGDISVRIADCFINATMWHLLEILSGSTGGGLIDASNIRVSMERTASTQILMNVTIVGMMQVRSLGASAFAGLHVSLVACSFAFLLVSTASHDDGRTGGVHVVHVETFHSLSNSAIYLDNVTVSFRGQLSITRRMRHTVVALLGRQNAALRDVRIDVRGIRWSARHSSDIVGVGTLEWVTMEALHTSIVDMQWDIQADGAVGANATFLTARSVFLVFIDTAELVINTSLTLTDAVGTVAVPRHPDRPLAIGLASTATVVYLGDASGSNVHVALANVSATFVLDEAVVSFSTFAALYPVSATLMMATASALTDASFRATACRLNVSLTVEAPAVSVPIPVMNVFAATSAVLELAANCTRCNVTIVRTDLTVSKLEMRPSPSSVVSQQTMHTMLFDCNSLFAVNATGFVMLVDTTPFSRCMGSFLWLIGAASMKYASPFPVVHRFLNITVADSVIFMPSSSPSSASGGAVTRPLAALYAPSVANSVSLEVHNVSVLQQGGEPPALAARDATAFLPYYTAALLLSNTSVNQVMVRATSVHHWQALVLARWSFGSVVRSTTVSVFNSTLTNDASTGCSAVLCGVAVDAYRPGTDDSPADVGGLTVAANASVFAGGYAAIAGGQLTWSGPPSSSPSLTLSVSLGCNDWNGRPTTMALYRQLVDSSHHRFRLLPEILLLREGEGEGAGACDATRTASVAPQPEESAVATPIQRTTGTSSAAVGTAGTAGAALSLASVSSVVRLQATMGALRIRQRCSADDADSARHNPDDSTAGLGDDDDGSATGSAFFDNPTQASIHSLGGGSTVALAAGAVLANAAVVVAFAVLVALIVEATALWGAIQAVRRRGVRSAMAAGGEVYAKLWRRLPGSGAAVFAMLLQPSLSCSIVLFITSNDQAPRGAGIAVGLVGVVFFVGGLSLMSYRVMRGFSLRAVRVHHAVPWRRTSKSKRGAAAVFWTWFDYVCSPAWEWVTAKAAASDTSVLHQGSTSATPPSSSSAAATARGLRPAVDREHQARVLMAYGALFEGYRPGMHGYFLLDLSAACVCGVLDALSLLGGCTAILWLFLAVSAVGAAVSVYVRPCASRLENGVLVVSNALTTITVALLLAAQSIADTNDATNQTVLSLEDGATAIALVQGVLCIATQLVAFATLLNVKYHLCRPPQYSNQWAASLWDMAPSTSVEQLLVDCLRRRAAWRRRGRRTHRDGANADGDDADDSTPSAENRARQERQFQADSLRQLITIACRSGRTTNTDSRHAPQHQQSVASRGAAASPNKDRNAR